MAPKCPRRSRDLLCEYRLHSLDLSLSPVLCSVCRLRLYLVALSFGAQVEVVASGFAFAEGPQWVNDEEVGLCRYHA